MGADRKRLKDREARRARRAAEHRRALKSMNPDRDGKAPPRAEGRGLYDPARIIGDEVAKAVARRGAEWVMDDAGRIGARVAEWLFG